MKEIEITIPENFSVDEASEFREKMNILINDNKKYFILNFKFCTFIDSTGLGVLVSIYKKCVELNGSLILSSIIDPNVLKVFKLTRLDKVFDIRN